MREIADWLEKLGMPEYAQRFAENGIDGPVLPHELIDMARWLRSKADGRPYSLLKAAEKLASMAAISAERSPLFSFSGRLDVRQVSTCPLPSN